MRYIAFALVAGCGSAAVTPGPAPNVARPGARHVDPVATLTGSRIVATAGGALVADADSGQLVALGPDAAPTARADIGRGVGQLVYDPARQVVFAADRAADRVIVLDAALHTVASWPTPAEPFGLALTPDRKTLLVTTIADRTLVALDTSSGAERWRAAIAAGARGVSASADGELAAVGSIATGAIEVVELGGEHRVATVPYDLACEHCETTAASARGTGSVQFFGSHVVATFQRSIPDRLIDSHTGLYGGGSRPPVTQHVALFAMSATGATQSVAQLVENQPRAFAWDAARDTLYVAGYGSDTLLALPGALGGDHEAIEAHASNAVLRASARCGPDGMAIAGAGELWMWCAFSRSVLRYDPAHQALVEGPAVAPSSYSEDEHAGLVLFHAPDRAINRDRALACASCHLDGLTDGLSWKIGPQALQTPLLAGRMRDTAPYRWDGSAASLADSLASTVHRLAGAGLSAGQTASLVAYLEALPRPRPPTRDAAAVARGRLVFEGDGGCAHCHGGAALTDRDQHDFESTLAHADTPSLAGLWSSAPYYHDGSAGSLGALLRGGGSVHGMADFARLTDAQRADLEVYLESL